MAEKIIAIVPSAGLGKRFDSSAIKTFAIFNGAPLLAHTLRALNGNASIDEIIPVLGEEDIDKGFEIVRKGGFTKITRIVPGGQERQDSIYNALDFIKKNYNITSDIIALIHDGARPVIPEGTVKRLLVELKDVDGAAPGLPPRDTLKTVNSNGKILSTINRDEIRAIQTPQAFRFDTIKKAYDSAYADGFYATDDAALLERIGKNIRIIPGSHLNIKVTTPEDLDIVECILAREKGC